jgi:hypothetical protein
MATVVSVAAKTVDDATSIAHSITPSAGHTLLAVCGSKDTTTHSLSISDSAWEEVATSNAGTPVNAAIGIWKLKDPTTGAAVSLTVSSSTTSNVLTLHLVEVEDANAVADYAILYDSRLPPTYRLGSVTMPGQNCLAIGCCFISNGNPAAPSGYATAQETINLEAEDVYLLTTSKTYAAAGDTGVISGTVSASTYYAYMSAHLALNAVATGGVAYGDIFRDHAF